MPISIKEFVSKLTIHPPQTSENLTVIPLSNSSNGGIDYISSEDAFRTGAITITERSEGGSVPELQAVNHSDTAVLVISGEEVVGAKQNRIMNVSILLMGRTTTTLPVSCSEQGRWHYKSRSFSSSKFISSPSIRRIKMRSVTESLRRSEERCSDQSAIWEKIDDLSRKSSVRSPTHAFSDILESRGDNLKAFLDHFPLLPDQTGMLVFFGSIPVLFEYISKPDVFRSIHYKSLAGCVLDADLAPKTPHLDITVSALFDEFNRCDESAHKSPGYGDEIRFKSPKLEGAALIADDRPVHLVACWTQAG